MVQASTSHNLQSSEQYGSIYCLKSIMLLSVRLPYGDCHIPSAHITPLAEEIRLCDNIFERLEKIKKFELHQKLEKEKRQVTKNQKKKEKSREARTAILI